VPILALLGAWAGHIAYTHPAVTRDSHGTAHVRPCEQAWPSQGETITGWCTWLTRYLPYALAHPWVGELHRQLGDLIARIRDLTHDVPHEHSMAAPCPECKAGGLVAIDGQWGITCRVCGHHLEPEAYTAHASTYLRTHQAAQDDAA
jgi:ribosomal protein S27E